MKRALIIFLVILSSIATTLSADAGNPFCTRYPERSSTRITPVAPFYLTSPGPYLLNRLPSVQGKDRYEIVLNYQFYPAAPAYIQFVSSCFARASRYLTGPSGESLTLRLPNAGDTRLAAVHAVTISEKCGYRGEAECWRVQYDCPTIFHETMHHLGLVDQYPDAGAAGGAGGNCRAVGPRDSVMYDPGQGFRKSDDYYHLEALECPNGATETEVAQCRHALDLVQAGHAYHIAGATLEVEAQEPAADPQTASAPPLRTSIHRITYDLKPQQEAQIQGADQVSPPVNIAYLTAYLFKTYGIQLGFKNLTVEALQAALNARLGAQRISPDRIELVTEVATAKPLLYPAEFSALVYTQCEVNRTFYACQKSAYENHFCHLPAECRTPAWVDFPAGVKP